MITIIGSVSKKIKSFEIANPTNYWFFKKDSAKQAVIANIYNMQTPTVTYEDGTTASVSADNLDIENFNTFIGSAGTKTMVVLCTINGQTVRTESPAKIYEESTWKTVWEGVYNIYGWESGSKHYISVNDTYSSFFSYNKPAQYSIPIDGLKDYLSTNLFTTDPAVKRKFRLTFYTNTEESSVNPGIYYNSNLVASPQNNLESVTNIIDNLNYPNIDWSTVSKNNNALVLTANKTRYNTAVDWYEYSVQLGINNGFVDVKSWSGRGEGYPRYAFGFRLRKIEVLD